MPSTPAAAAAPCSSSSSICGSACQDPGRAGHIMRTSACQGLPACMCMHHVSVLTSSSSSCRRSGVLAGGVLGAVQVVGLVVPVVVMAMAASSSPRTTARPQAASTPFVSADGRVAVVDDRSGWGNRGVAGRVVELHTCRGRWQLRRRAVVRDRDGHPASSPEVDIWQAEQQHPVASASETTAVRAARCRAGQVSPMAASASSASASSARSDSTVTGGPPCPSPSSPEGTPGEHAPQQAHQRPTNTCSHNTGC